MKNRTFWLPAGFLLFIFGFTSLILQMVGVHYAFLQFLEIPGILFAFVAKIFLTVAGVVIVTIANTDWERDIRESSEDKE